MLWRQLRPLLTVVIATAILCGTFTAIGVGGYFVTATIALVLAGK